MKSSSEVPRENPRLEPQLVNDEMKVVYQGKITDVDFVRMLLEDEGIETVLTNEGFSFYLDSACPGVPPGVAVQDTDAERATEIVADFVSKQRQPPKEDE